MTPRTLPTWPTIIAPLPRTDPAQDQAKVLHDVEAVLLAYAMAFGARPPVPDRKAG
jgi:hypothetical protein